MHVHVYIVYTGGHARGTTQSLPSGSASSNAVNSKFIATSRKDVLKTHEGLNVILVRGMIANEQVSFVHLLLV